MSTSPLDAFTNPIRAAIQPREYGLKNRQRTNRMLMLMQLHANRHDDVHAYTHLIREWLQINKGAQALTGGRSPTLAAFPPSADRPTAS